jgi:type IV secretion system protein TrbI
VITAEPAPASVPPKVDPETLAIRARPKRAIRFKRSVIIGISALGSASLVALTYTALKPTIFMRVVEEQELSQPTGKSSSDVLNDLPASYGAVPKLGPPLPGDLGRPILDHQRALGQTSVGTPDVGGQAVAAEIEQRRAQLKAARESGLLVSSAAHGPSETPTAPVTDTQSLPSAKLPLDPAKDPNAQGRKAEFVSALDARGPVNPHRLAGAPSPYLLSAGSVIAASLITGLRSDLPGLVTAQVTQQVFDSPTGRLLLIPQGARLIGSYDSVVAFGQRRALVVWQRIVMPDGSSLAIDNVPGTDPSGYSGLADKVDFHTWQLLKGVALATLLGVGAEASISGESDLVQAIRESTQQNASRAGDQLTSRNISIQPTITVRPGTPVRLVVHKDLVLAPWRGD